MELPAKSIRDKIMLNFRIILCSRSRERVNKSSYFLFLLLQLIALVILKHSFSGMSTPLLLGISCIGNWTIISIPEQILTPCYHNRTIKDDEKLLLQNIYMSMLAENKRRNKIIVFPSLSFFFNIFMQQLFLRNVMHWKGKNIESEMISVDKALMIVRNEFWEVINVIGYLKKQIFCWLLNKLKLLKLNNLSINSRIRSSILYKIKFSRGTKNITKNIHRDACSDKKWP